MKVREVSIKYGTTKKRNLKKEQQEIEISITTLEEQLTRSDVNDKEKKQIWSDIEGKKRELERVIEYQTKGAILRSKQTPCLDQDNALACHPRCRMALIFLVAN